MICEGLRVQWIKDISVNEMKNWKSKSIRCEEEDQFILLLLFDVNLMKKNHTVCRDHLKHNTLENDG
jgi:hypothetical protein